MQERKGGEPRGPCHGDDITLERAVHNIPRALVDNERRLSVVFRVLVRWETIQAGGVRYPLE